jgi:hypothetical protein
MATSLTRFEIQLPLFADGSSGQIAVDLFISNMSTLCTVCQYGAFTGPRSNPGEVTILYGLISAGQQSTALGYLTSLNGALGTNVTCTVNAVTSEP